MRRRKVDADRLALRQNHDAIKARCRTLAGFVKEAWHVLEPSNPLKWSWHLDAMCEHLQAISEGALNPRLIINVPPGSSKSMIVSVLWQAWEWGPRGKPSMRFLTSSFEEENVKRDTRKTRDLIKSEWYQSLWPEITLTRAGETSFANAATGTREGVPFASITGKRGDRFVIDDPHSLDGAESPTEREKATRRFLEGGLNRVNDQTTSAIVVVMQRLHEADLSGVLLSRQLGFVHLMIPMEFEPERRCETPIWSDPRSYDGELMDTVRMPREAVDLLKNVSDYSWSGQYQQRPVPREGGLFKLSWFGELVEPELVPPAVMDARAWDLAATVAVGGADPDWTVGLRGHRSADGTFYVTHMIRLRDTPGKVAQMINGTARNRDGKGVRIRLPEDPGQAGKSQTAFFVNMLAGHVVIVKRPTGSKYTRAGVAATQAQHGKVRIVRGDWNKEFFDEVCMFPAGRHDDIVDAFADLISELADARGYSLDNL